MSSLLDTCKLLFFLTHILKSKQIISINKYRVSSPSLFCLLQSFLKELPGSLLVSDLYDNWMTALGNEDTQQRALEIRK